MLITNNNIKKIETLLESINLKNIIKKYTNIYSLVLL